MFLSTLRKKEKRFVNYYKRAPMNNKKELLVVEGVSKYFGGIHALDGVDLTVKEGSIHGIIGPNGSGKTTLFNVITSLYPVTAGKIYYDSKDITDIRPDLITDMGISRTFQKGIVAPKMNTTENVMVGSYSSTNLEFFPTILRIPFTSSAQEKETRKKALELLDLVDLKEFYRRMGEELVWVEIQLTQIARALAGKPKLLLLDEPTGGMGIEESQKLEKIIKYIRDELGITVVVVAHDVRLVTKISDTITVLSFGKKIKEGSPVQIQNDPQVLEVYLGKD
jgi:branched-chain amino acid transport system ATP-binding protein